MAAYTHHDEGPTDEALLARFRATHDAEAFAALVHRYERELFGYLRRYLHDPEMAEDVFQATFLRVHLKSDQFEAGRRFRPWLYAIATHQAIDARRRDRRHRQVGPDGRRAGLDDHALATCVAGRNRTGDETAADTEARDWIRAAVAGLTQAQRAVITLVYERGVKYREAAKILGVPVGTVKSRLHAALVKLGGRPDLRRSLGLVSPN